MLRFFSFLILRSPMLGDSRRDCYGVFGLMLTNILQYYGKIEVLH